jgi:PIN domain nuclease of toxin-antitoxin system
MAAHKEQGQRELAEVIVQAMGSDVTVAEVSGAKNMLALLHDALPD